MSIEPKNPAKRKRAVSAHVVPGPPSNCQGFLYTVHAKDTLHTISKKFKCPLPKLLETNPQLNTRSGVFASQIICIPEIRVLQLTKFIDPLAPRVLFVEFFGPFGEPLPVQNGFVLLAARTFIRVVFSRPVMQAFFFLAPTGTSVFWPVHLVGVEIVEPKQRVVRFTWDVPLGTRGSLFIIGCNEFICGPPEEVLVRRV